MSHRESGIFYKGEVALSALAIAADFVSESIALAQFRILGSGQVLINGSAYGNTTLTVTPQLSVDGVTFFDLTDFAKVFSAAVPNGTLTFPSYTDFARIKVAYTGNGTPLVDAQFCFTDAEVKFQLPLSAGATSSTSVSASGAITGATTLGITGAATIGGALAAGASTLNSIICTTTALISGLATFTAGLIITGVLKLTKDTRTGAGAIAITTPLTEIVSTAADALTMIAPVGGEVKIITMKTDGGDATLTPVNLIGGTTITFSAVGQSAILVGVGTNWHIVAVNGAVIGA